MYTNPNFHIRASYKYTLTVTPTKKRLPGEALQVVQCKDAAPAARPTPAAAPLLPPAPPKPPPATPNLRDRLPTYAPTPPTPASKTACRRPASLCHWGLDFTALSRSAGAGPKGSPAPPALGSDGEPVLDRRLVVQPRMNARSWVCVWGGGLTPCLLIHTDVKIMYQSQY